MNSEEDEASEVHADERLNDFVKDSLYARSSKSAKFVRFKHLNNVEQNNWEVFHWSTRSKLEAAIYFYGLIRGWAYISHVLSLRVNPDALLDWIDGLRRCEISQLRCYVNFMADLVEQVWQQFPAGVRNEVS